MANPQEIVPQRGLAYAAGQRVGQGIMRTKAVASQRLSQSGAMIRERQAGAQAAAGARSVRGGFARAGSRAAQSSSEIADAAKNMQVKGGMVLFWLVAGCAVIKDVIDVASALIDAIGLALTATVAGALVGVPLGVFSEILDKASGIFIDLTVVAYFSYIGGSFALRLVIMSIGAIIDAVPGLDVLPLTTVSFFAAYLLGRAVKKALEVQSSSLGRTVAGVSRGVAAGGRAAAGVGRAIASKLA